MSKIEIDKNTKGLRIARAVEVWRRGRNGMRYIDPTHIYGRVDRDMPHVVLNKNVANRFYINDFSNLSKNLKKDIINEFEQCSSSERRVIYLVDSQFNRPRQNNRRNGRNNNRNNNR